MWVQQLGEALEPVSAAASPLVGPAWREVPAFTLVFGAIFFAALPFWVRSQRLAGGLCAAHPCLQLLLPLMFRWLAACASNCTPGRLLCLTLPSAAASAIHAALCGGRELEEGGHPVQLLHVVGARPAVRAGCAAPAARAAP